MKTARRKERLRKKERKKEAKRAKKRAKFAAKIKAKILKLGTGKDARIDVKLNDRTKVKGYVNEIKDDSFVVINEKTGVSTEVQYSQTKQIKGNNLSKKVKIAICVVLFILLVTPMAISDDGV